MGRTTSIEWCHSTFNPWRGCSKVSAGCKHCYAETFAKTNPAVLGQWGGLDNGGTRVIASPAMWREPLRWNARREKLLQEQHPNSSVNVPSHRVFCGSMCDVCEDLRELDAPRDWLRALIDATPYLTWMLLTKRPHNIQRLLLDGWRDEFPEHVWVGTTVEHQDAAEDRVPVLLNIPARTRFLSVEPMLGPVDVSTWLGYSDAWTRWVGPCGCDNQRDPWDRCDDCVNRGWVPPQCRGINLVICGGESAAGARAFDLDWARDLRDQCAERDVAFFFKQMGSNPVGLTHPVHGPILPDHRSGADMGEVPADLRVRQMPINEHPWRVPA